MPTMTQTIFFVSVVDMYIVECVLEHFGMVDINSALSIHIPPQFMDDEEKIAWFSKEIGEMIQNKITPKDTKENEVEDTGIKTFYA